MFYFKTKWDKSKLLLYLKAEPFLSSRDGLQGLPLENKTHLYSVPYLNWCSLSCNLYAHILIYCKLFIDFSYYTIQGKAYVNSCYLYCGIMTKKIFLYLLFALLVFGLFLVQYFLYGPIHPFGMEMYIYTIRW